MLSLIYFNQVQHGVKCFFCDWGFTIWLSHTIGSGSWSILNGRVSYLRVGNRFGLDGSSRQWHINYKDSVYKSIWDAVQLIYEIGMLGLAQSQGRCLKAYSNDILLLLKDDIVLHSPVLFHYNVLERVNDFVSSVRLS